MQIEKNGGCYVMKCWQCHHQFCWACQRAWKDHTQDHFSCPYYKPEEDKYKKQFDDVYPPFLDQYNQVFLRKRVFGAMLREKMDELVEDIARRTSADGYSHDEVAAIVRKLLGEMCWATENLRWAQVHMFTERHAQVKNLVGEAQMSQTDPPLTPHQRLFAKCAGDLDGVVSGIDKKVRTAATARIALKDVIAWTREIAVFRATLLKHCDTYYRDSAEWTAI